MINRNKLEHILEYAKQQRYIGQSCKVPPEDMVEIMERLLSACNSPAIPEGSTAGMFNSARALLDDLYEFGPDEIAISEHVTNLEDALRNAAAPQEVNHG